ncbi:MAG: RNA polymerase factor sigma-54 [Synergistaceae bacterium]|jgi:RNA polymerase sigma-54 factor|nr:RNA polymerase factor sigma-54 [Synergistaceae bacterium]
MDLRGSVLQEQRQVMSPRQIESINILAMNALNLYEFVMKEQEDNPLIESVPQEPFRAAGGTAGIERLPEDLLSNIPYYAAETPADFLLPQIDMRKFNKVEEAAFRLIAESLNDSGWLTATPEELSGFSGIPVGVLQKCLGVMKGLEPAGVCASSLAECLELQLRADGVEDGLLLDIVRNHLNNVAVGSINRVAQETASDAQKVKDCLALIRSLNPRPLNGLVGEKACGVVPDVILSHECDSWRVELNDGGFRSFAVTDCYARLAAETGDEELKEYFIGKLQRVKFLNDAIERRRKTLTNIGWLLTRRQSDFLLRGGYPVPLPINAAAEELGLHSSTVSRAIKEKYIQFPCGFSELRALFAREAARRQIYEAETRKGARVSKEEVKQRIRDILDSREKRDASHLSDAKITAMLSDSGIVISRRTVAKYRSEMGIAGMRNRG